MDIKPQPSESVDLIVSPPTDPRRLDNEESKKEKDDLTIRINSIGENNPKEQISAEKMVKNKIGIPPLG